MPLPPLALPIASFGFNVLSSIFGSGARKKQQRAQYRAQARQATQSATDARINAELLGIQREAFTRQSEEQIGDISEEGESVFAERAALAAAEGFGGGGTARSAQAGIRRKISRDITRVRGSLAEQTNVFNLQQQQQLGQAAFFEEEATFATQLSGDSGISFDRDKRNRENDPLRFSR